MTRMTVAELTPISYHHATMPAEVHDIIRQARANGPLALGPYGPEILGYELVRAVLRDERFEVPRGMFLAAQGITSGPLWERANNTLVGLGGPAHLRLRRLVARAFIPKAAERLRATCVDIVTELVARCVPAGRCDVVADLAVPYAVPVICALLGAPARDWARFSAWADEIFKMFSWDLGEHAEAVETAWKELDAYVDDMVVRRRHTLTDDLLSDLIRAEDDGDRLTHHELLMLAGGVLLAGTDTTRNQLAAAVETLCDHPREWELLAENPELAPTFVEELMRYSPATLGTVRIAKEEVEIADVTIPAGTLVAVNTAAANRDPQVFADPDRFDVHREAPPPMLGFGGGLHYCLGVHLARIELAEALRVITATLRHPHRDGPAPWKPMTGITGPATLPLAFDAA